MSASGQYKTWPLPGGIYLDAHKEQTLGTAIRSAPMPQQLVLAITQPDYSVPVLHVRAGDFVLKGQLLAQGTSDAGINIHASTSGTVIAIEPRAVANASGLQEPCIIVEPDGQEQWSRMTPIPDFLNCAQPVLVERIKDAGICGLGGAAFPTHVKLASAVSIHTLVLNACECEPYISCDETLLHHYAADVITGILILLRITNAARCLIGIEDSKLEAIAALKNAITDARIELNVIPALYPSGAERQLIYSMTGIEIAADTLPVAKGFLCHNPGTARAVMRAVIFGEAMVSRITTITGAALAAPGNFDLLFGTPIDDLLQLCGIINTTPHRLIVGGPLMGIELTNGAAPISAATNCVLAATAAELPLPLPEQACIRCGFCVPACPVLLQPQVLYWDIRQHALAEASAHNLHGCIECGACAYVCPSHIPLVQYFRAAKAALDDEQEHKAMANASRQRFEFHQARIHAERLRLEQRRAERAALTRPDASQPANSAQATIEAALARVKARKLEQSQAAAASKQDAENGDAGS
jgi:electron transport complex protein RnfC